MMTSLEDSWKT